MDARKGSIGVDFVRPESLGSLSTTVISYAVSQGLSLDEIAQVIDISELDYANQNARLPDLFVGELMTVLADKLPDRAVSMEIAHCAPFSMFGGLVQGALFATDFEAALNWFVENTSIIADQSAVHLEKTASEGVLVLAHPCEFMDNGYTMEATMGVLWRFLSTITVPGASLQRVEFANKKAVKLRPYEEFFQAPVLFQAGRNALVFSLDIFCRPVRSANPQMFELIKQHFVELRQKLNDDNYPAALAPLRRSIMDNAAHGEYGAAAAAAAANLSLRTAQRLATQHGTSLQKLIDEIRLTNAKNFLSSPEITVETVAQLLGYANARAFRRAFNRWTGLSPKEYRNEILKSDNEQIGN